MPLHNPINLYTGDAVTVDALPYVRHIEALRQRRQARTDAIDQYYQNLPNTVNEKGVRDQEVPLINEQKDKIQQYWMQHRDAIAKGNTPEAFNHGKMFRDLEAAVNYSKNATGQSTKLSDIRKNPKFDYVFRSPEFMEKLRRHELPINHPEHETINFEELSKPPAPFDPNKYFKGFSDIKYDYTTSLKPHPTDNTLQIEVQTPKLGEQQKEEIYRRAGANVIHDYSFEEGLKKEMEQDPSLLNKLQKVFKDNYGREINPVSADTDLAAAYTILGMTSGGTKEKSIPNFRVRESIRNANISGRSKSVDTSLINDVYDVIETKFKENLSKSQATLVNSLPSEAVDFILKVARNNTGNNDLGVDDIALYKSPNGNIGIYQAKGRNIVYDAANPSKSLIGEISKVGTNMGKQPDVKAKRAVVAEGNPKPKSYSLKGKTYSESQVSAAAKASGMSVDEYIKAAGLK